MAVTSAPDRPESMDAKGNRNWVYPAAIAGLFMRWRRRIGYFVMAIFFAMPWIDMGGLQSILIQIPERRFIFFGRIFWPHDLFYLVFLLLGAALALFFFTALAGRVWCGWLCPQTVFLEEVFRKIEEWVEGNHHVRQRLDNGPWSLEKVWRKGAKHALFLLVAALVSNTALAYFVGREQLLVWMLGSPFDHPTAFLFMAVNMGAFYFDYAWFREQFCIILCPYARLQSVLTDANTLQVGYDVVRGEPRGKVGQVSGDCIDCHKCVAVCPTGIDIRHGFQMECIGCARCIDACDGIMDSVGRDKGLIRYDSETNLEGGSGRILRPRVVLYSVLLVAMIVAFFWGVGTRPLLEVTVRRPPGDPYSLLGGDVVSNHFSIQMINKAPEPKVVMLSVDGPEETRFIVPVNPMTLPAGQQSSMEVFITIPRSAVPTGKSSIQMRLFNGESLLTEHFVTFLGPVTP